MTTTNAFTTPPARPVHDGPAMPAARQKSGAGRVGFVGPVMAVLLVAIGAVLLHDAIARADSRPGRTWIAAIVAGLDGLTA